MPCGRLESLFRSLRFQLTFWNATAILLLVLATFLGLRLGLRSMLQNEMDDLLDADMIEVQLILHHFHPDWAQIKEELNRKAISHKTRAWFVRIYCTRGKLRVATTGAPDPVIPSETTPAGAFDVADYRVLQKSLSSPGSGLVVRLGCSRDFVNDNVNNLTKILLIAGLAFLVVAPLSGYLLAGRATQPLAVILQTAARLQPGRLAERVPVSGCGDELDRLAATLNGLLDRLANHIDRQRVFVANAAHELRSPLAALRASAEIALAQERSAEEYRELIADIIDGCDSLGGLVNQLLLLAEGDAGLIRFAGPVSLHQLAARAVDMFRGSAEVRNLNLELDLAEPASVHGSETHLRQVISNLLDNAIKFTPEGGRIILSVRQMGSNAIVQVRDTGIGITADELPHIFERFYRADKARRRDRDSGNGLGLSICQALVGAHGGHIAAESRSGYGTLVTVTLPVSPAATVINPR